MCCFKWNVKCSNPTLSSSQNTNTVFLHAATVLEVTVLRSSLGITSHDTFLNFSSSTAIELGAQKSRPLHLLISNSLYHTTIRMLADWNPLWTPCLLQLAIFLFKITSKQQGQQGPTYQQQSYGERVTCFRLQRGIITGAAVKEQQVEQERRGRREEEAASLLCTGRAFSGVLFASSSSCSRRRRRQASSFFSSC